MAFAKGRKKPSVVICFTASLYDINSIDRQYYIEVATYERLIARWNCVNIEDNISFKILRFIQMLIICSQGMYGHVNPSAADTNRTLSDSSDEKMEGDESINASCRNHKSNTTDIRSACVIHDKTEFLENVYICCKSINCPMFQDGKESNRLLPNEYDKLKHSIIRIQCSNFCKFCRELHLLDLRLTA